MLQFLGLHFLGNRVQAVLVDQKGIIIQDGSAAIAGIAAPAAPAGAPGPAAPGVLEAPPQEWVRAGSLALRDAYFSLAANKRRLWGVALAGPQGWIGIDHDLDAITPLRLTPGASPIDDLRSWLEANPRTASHLFTVLSPKDYFRFKISGALAADLTQASQTGLLQEGRSFWSPEKLMDLGLEMSWFPPAFDCATPTGRISEAGMELCGVPESLWLVAGSDSLAAAEFSAAGDRLHQLHVLIEENAAVLRFGIEADSEIEAPAGWERAAAARVGWHSLMRRETAPGGSEWTQEALEASLREAEAALSSRGWKPACIILDSRAPLPPWSAACGAGLAAPSRAGFYAGRPEPGAAFFAGLAKKSFRDATDLFRKLERSRPDPVP